MRIKFTTSGTSPDLGVFDAGLERDVPQDIGSLFIERGLAIEVSVLREEEDEHGG